MHALLLIHRTYAATRGAIRAVTIGLLRAILGCFLPHVSGNTFWGRVGVGNGRCTSAESSRAAYVNTHLYTNTWGSKVNHSNATLARIALTYFFARVS